jgi:DNA-binding transcriptional ArsR family regulator
MAVPESTLDLETLCELLGNEKRRRTLRILAEHGEMTLEELVQELHVGVGERRTERLKIRLHHVHLPKLADHGGIEYDPATKVISMTGERQHWQSLLDDLVHGEVTP